MLKIIFEEYAQAIFNLILGIALISFFSGVLGLVTLV